MSCQKSWLGHEDKVTQSQLASVDWSWCCLATLAAARQSQAIHLDSAYCAIYPTLAREQQELSPASLLNSAAQQHHAAHNDQRVHSDCATGQHIAWQQRAADALSFTAAAVQRTL